MVFDVGGGGGDFAVLCVPCCWVWAARLLDVFNNRIT